MKPELQPDAMLLDRFVLERGLLVGPSSALWTARDLQLEAGLLLRVYFRAGTLPPGGGEGVLHDTIRRDVRQSRGLRHPHLARIHDLHEGDGLLLVSIEGYDGALLSSVLDEDAPVPYRSAVAQIRPLVEALLHVHERGGEYGRLEPDHVLVDEQSRLILLPGDATRTSRSDLRRLGHLMAALLTGGREPQPERSLNDLSDRLHRGRTVPALLDQLVTDLMTTTPARGPAGMLDVLRRLEQIESFVEPAETAAQEAAPPQPPPPPSPPPSRPVAAPAGRPGRRRGPVPMRAVVAWLIPALVIGAAIVFMAMYRPRPAAPTTAEIAAPAPPAGIAGDPPRPEDDAGTDSDAAIVPEIDPRQLAAERAGAEEALAVYLGARLEADEIGAAAWGGPPYEQAAGLGAEADRSFLDARYVDAVAQYTDAAAGMTRVVEGRDDALVRLLEDGAAALAAGDSPMAAVAYGDAVRIAPDDERVKVGLARAASLDEVRRLLASGREHEREGRLAYAHADYVAATQMDPHSNEAATAAARVGALLAEAHFQDLMTRALEAYHDGDFAEARARLLETQAIRPDAPEVAPALAMVEEARLRREVRRLRDEALVHEEHEQWQAAWNAYRRVLLIDPDVQLAQEGRARSETMIRLERHAQHFLDNPKLLTAQGTREDAMRLVEELDQLERMGPRLQRLHDSLAEKVRLANTPRRVVISSDEKTDIDVYRVGRFGSFDSIELELLPGTYTVVGHRKGYKDVRVTLDLEPGLDAAALEVTCTESIR